MSHCERLQIHQLGAAGVGHVGDVDSARRAAGELPDEKRVDVAEEQVAGFGFCARAARHYSESSGSSAR